MEIKPAVQFLPSTGGPTRGRLPPKKNQLWQLNAATTKRLVRKN
jgi:hypothetical protein